MRVPWVPLGCLVVLLMLCLPARGTLGEGGIDPRLPGDLYGDDVPHPQVDLVNATFEEGGRYQMPVTVRLIGHDTSLEMRVSLRIYGWGMFGSELGLDDLDGPLPSFVGNHTGTSEDPERYWSVNATVPADAAGITLGPLVDVPQGGARGYYRVSVGLEWTEGSDSLVAYSRGHFLEAEWADLVNRVHEGTDPVGVDFLLSEGGFSLVPPHFNYVSQPNRVPDFGNFTTPVIRPGDSGRYNFTVTNRYDLEITDVHVTVEFYMWATIEDSKPIDRISGPPPKVSASKDNRYVLDAGTIAPGQAREVRLDIRTSKDTDKGTYFVRHSISFEYEGEGFTISSRGFFAWDQWEGFDYSNLYYQLGGSAGIVPDSSFSVKDPVPLWPLATLIGLCVLFGALAVVFYLAEEHGDQYPRLKRGLQRLTGRWEQRKRLLQQRMDELRGEGRGSDGADDRSRDKDRAD